MARRTPAELGRGSLAIAFFLLLAGAVSSGSFAVAQPPAAVLLPPLDMPPANDSISPAPVPGAMGLTLAELENLALANNPTIPQAAALVQQQQGLMRQASLYPNPTAGYVRTDPDQSGQSQTQGVFLSQEFVTAGKLRLARSAGQQEVQRSNWQLQAQRTRVLNDVRIRFFEVLGAQQAVLAAEELEALAVEGVQVAEQLLKAKQGSRPDVLQAEIQLSAVRTSLQGARYRQQAAWRQLANVAGVPALQPAPLAGSLEISIPDLEWQPSLEQLLAASPLLRAQQAEIRAAEYELKLARAQAIPNVNVQLVAERDHIEKFSTITTLVSLPIPLFNRNQGNIQSAEAVLLQQQREYDRIRLALTDQLAGSFRQYLTLRSQAARLQREILPKARENLDLTTQGYKLGRFDFMRVLSARQTYFQTKLAHIDALTELHKTAIEIIGLQLTGGLNPTEAGTALQSTPGAATTGIRGVLLQQLQEQRGAASRNLPGAIQAGER
ncbi:MAG TPA: TolC family protein [Gemmataceae bacterium]|nr:TolC family protein [Gemmataceae bacterium]